MTQTAYDGSPAQYVWSKNAERRQLNASQRALAAQALMPWLEEEARERREATQGRPQKLGTNRDSVSDQPHDPNPRAGKAAKHAARVSGVGTTTIYKAKTRKSPHTG